jgi:hypothetical protein
MRKKTILAIAFASSVLCPTLPTLAEKALDSSDPEIQEIPNEKNTDPRSRAESLLRYASKHLPESVQYDVDLQLLRMHYVETRKARFKKYRRWDLLDLGNREILSEIDARKKFAYKDRDLQKFQNEEKRTLANQATQQALNQIANCNDRYVRLYLYLVALQLFHQTDNIDGMQQCNGFLEKEFQRCEKNAHVDEIEIDESISVLNQMANNLIHTYISTIDLKTYPLLTSTLKRSPPPTIEPFTEEDFVESEKLRLRALAIADRLPPEHHLRRRAHRDLVLWYQQLGKNEKAENEKSILFDLVGIRDDSILYPQPGMCGRHVWWQKVGTVAEFGCGMG